MSDAEPRRRHCRRCHNIFSNYADLGNLTLGNI